MTPSQAKGSPLAPFPDEECTGSHDLTKPPDENAPALRLTVGPRIIIFALDGAGPDQLMQAIRSGKAPHIAGLLGKEKGSGLFDHAYAAPHALSILPSSTIAAPIFTGNRPAWNGVSGDEYLWLYQHRHYIFFFTASAAS